MCFDEWLKVDSNQLAPNTINLYKQTYNKYVKNTIGKEKLVLLKYKEIQAFINKSDELSLSIPDIVDYSDNIYCV